MMIHNALQMQALALSRRWFARAWRWSGMACLWLALALRALIPQGFMPAAEQPGQDVLFAMVVCTPDGPMEFQHSQAQMVVGGDAASDPTQQAHTKTLCSFSVLAWQALLDGVWLTLLLLLLLKPLRAQRRRYCAPVWRPCTAIQAPRGPPLLV